MKSVYPEIVVVIGSGRSGTTYLTRMLKETMDIGFSAEPKFIVPLYKQLHRFGDLRVPANMRRLVEKIHQGPLFQHLHRVVGIPSHSQEILDRLKEPNYTGVLYATFQLIADKRGNSRLGYKDPADVMHLPILSKLLPSAKFVHIIRDGRDVALSLLKFRWGATNLYSGGRYWARTVTTGRQHGAQLGDRYFELRLEDLVLDTTRVATALGHFVNGGFHSNEVQRLIDRISETCDRNTIEIWRNKLNSRQRFLCEAGASDALRECGYSTEIGSGATLNPLVATWYRWADFIRRAKNRFISSASS